MEEQEVWVRMMAACIANPTPGTTEDAANGADAAVAEWRKRYGAKAECQHTTVIDTMPPMCAKCGKQLEDAPAPADDKPWHKCSDRMPGDLLPRIVVDRDGCVGFARQMLPYSEKVWLKPADSEIGGIVAWRDLPDAPAEFAWKPAPAPFKPGDLVSVVSGYYKGQAGAVATVYADDDPKYPGVISVLLPGCAPHFRAEHLKHR